MNSIRMPLPNRTSWKLTASHNEKELSKAVDGDITTRWDTRKPQAPDMWLQIELPAETEITGLLLDTGRSGGDYPREYQIQLSNVGVFDLIDQTVIPHRAFSF